MDVKNRLKEPGLFVVYLQKDGGKRKAEVKISLLK